MGQGGATESPSRGRGAISWTKLVYVILKPSSRRCHEMNARRASQGAFFFKNISADPHVSTPCPEAHSNTHYMNLPATNFSNQYAFQTFTLFLNNASDMARDLGTKRIWGIDSVFPGCGFSGNGNRRL